MNTFSFFSHNGAARMGSIVRNVSSNVMREYAFDIAADDPAPAPSPAPVPAPAPAAPSGGADYISRSEFSAVAAERDRQKANAEAYAAKLTELEGRIKSHEQHVQALGGDPQKAAQELEDLRKFKTESELAGKSEMEKLQAALNGAQNAHKSDVEKHQQMLTKTTEEHQKAVMELQAKLGELKNYQLQAEIRRFASDAGAANPAQIVKMLAADFTVGADDSFVFSTTTEKGTPIQQTIEERVKAFLAMDENANLLAAPGTPRAKAPGSISGTPGKTTIGGVNTPASSGSGDTTYLQQLGRKITDEEKNKITNHGRTDEEIAMGIVMADRARKRQEEAAKSRNGRLPGEITFPGR